MYMYLFAAQSRGDEYDIDYFYYTTDGAYPPPSVATPLAYDDNNGSGTYSKITKTLDAGTYYVKVKEKNDNTVDSYNIKLLVGGSPYASFTYTPSLGLTTGNITFNASDSYDPDGSISSYSWDFDASDGIQEDATGVEVTRQYTTAGNYTVTLTVTGTSGTDTVSKNVTVKAPPVADFSYSGSGTEISFTDLSTDPDGGEIIGWYWDFEDGTTNTTPNPTHVFEQGETDYVVTLVVMDNDSLVNKTTKVVHAGSGPVNEPPDADFTYSITPLENTTFMVQFNSTSTDSDGSVTGWLWEFGDGTLSLLENVTHNYTSTGTYTVNLTVTDDDGAADSTSKVINILAAGAITTCEELQDMKNNLSGTYYLANDIDCSDTVNWNGGAGFEPIGKSSNPFTGTFDGRGYKITALYINRPSTDYVGLFSYTDSGSEIKDVTLENITVEGDWWVGGLAAVNNGTISGSCSISGTVSGCDGIGLVGFNDEGGIVSNSCSIGGSVSGTWDVGGIVGWNYYGTVQNSYSTTSATHYNRVGGLVGYNHHGTVRNSYSTGSVSGYDYVGGLVGRNAYGTVQNSYSTGSVSSGDPGFAGGLIGWDESGTVLHSYWDIETSGQSSSHGGEGKTTAEMKQQATFVGWDFTDIWAIIEDETYPLLRWQPVRVHNLDTGEEFATIQEAVDAVNTTDGHTITVDPGTDNENVNVYKSLTIRSTSGNPADTIVQAAEPNDHVFEVTADYVNISGFTVTGATGDEKAGIYLYGADHSIVSNNNISNCYYGIRVSALWYCDIKDNFISNCHSGIKVGEGPVY